MILFKLFCCLAFFTLTGWAARGLFSTRKDGNEPLFFDLLTGMALLSLLYFGLATAGWFHGKTILGASVVLGLALWYTCGRRLPQSKEVLLLILFPLFASLIAICLYRATPPYQAIVRGDDASTYSAAAWQLARTGSLSYRDALVLEMTPSQKEAFFRNRYREDWTGPYVRFAGGVRLTDPETGTVHFAFYHMTPVWLAFAIKIFGPIDYQLWISLISALSFLGMFFLGKRLGGIPAGIALPVLLFLFYPQQYFSRFPMSELPAQLFFLAGLLSLIQSLDIDAGSRGEEMRRTGVLWGAAFLCRVDALFMIVLFLVICIPCVPLFARDRRRWLPLVRILAVCALAAALNQFAAGEYISLFTNSQNLGHSTLTDLGLDIVTVAGAFIRAHTGLTTLIFIAAAGAILFAPWPSYFSRGRQLKTPMLIALSIVVAAAMLLPVTGVPDFGLLLNHIRWFSPYAPAALYGFLASGVIVLAFFEHRKPAVQVCLVFFMLALVVYLFRPLIMPGQPWSMRRFVPILVPLFFLLSLSGWSRALLLVRAAGARSRAVMFCAAAAASGFLLYSKSAYLLRAPLYQGIFASCDALAARIPQGALVLIPDAMAGLHLELPLRYRNGIDTLMLPLDYKTGRLLSPTVRNFVDTRMQKGPVILLSSLGTDLIYPLWKYYQPALSGSEPFSILHVNGVGRYEYPGQTEQMTFNASLYKLSPPAPARLPGNAISYDEPEVTFLHFHEKETGFRWTREESILTDFTYPVDGKDVDLFIEIGPMPPGFQPQHPDLVVVANYEFAADFVGGDEHLLHYRVRAGSIGEIHAVSLLAKTFREQTGVPPRDLGISFVRLTFR